MIVKLPGCVTQCLSHLLTAEHEQKVQHQALLASPYCTKMMSKVNYSNIQHLYAPHFHEWNRPHMLPPNKTFMGLFIKSNREIY